MIFSILLLKCFFYFYFLLIFILVIHFIILKEPSNMYVYMYVYLVDVAVYHARAIIKFIVKSTGMMSIISFISFSLLLVDNHDRNMSP